MKLSKEDIRIIVRRVLNYYIWKKSLPEEQKKSLFLIPSHPVALDETLARYELYGEMDSFDFLLENPGMDIPALKGADVFFGSSRADVQRVFNSLTQYEKLEVYSPPVDFLRDLKAGREENIFVRIALYFLMTGKPVTVRVPYSRERMPQGRFSKMMKDLQNDLWDMGVAFEDAGSEFDMREEQELITEKTIEEAYAKGQKQIFASDKTIITPLALERAGELNVNIIKNMKNGG